jgi:putative ABC transport system substrate-binding protein
MVLGAAAAALAGPLAHGQVNQSGRIKKVDFLNSGPKLPRTNPFWVAWFGEMEKLGLTEGKNFTFDFRAADGDFGKLDAIAADLLATGVDVVLANTDVEVLAMRRVSKTVPVVVCIGQDPIGSGYAKSLAQPGGMITGMVWSQSIEIVQRDAQLMKALMPGVTRSGGIYDSNNRALEAGVEAFNQAARKLGFTHTAVSVSKPEDYEAAFATLAARGCQTVIDHGTAMIYLLMGKFVEFARMHRMADFYYVPEAVELGGLMSLGVDLVDLFRRSAGHVDKILNGAKPGELPMQLPLKYDLVLNAKTANSLGISIPQWVKIQADRIIE